MIIKGGNLSDRIFTLVIYIIHLLRFLIEDCYLPAFFIALVQLFYLMKLNAF